MTTACCSTTARRPLLAAHSPLWPMFLCAFVVCLCVYSLCKSCAIGIFFYLSFAPKRREAKEREEEKKKKMQAKGYNPHTPARAHARSPHAHPFAASLCISQTFSGLAALGTRVGLVLVEEPLVGQALGALVVPLLECRGLHQPVNANVAPLAAVVIARVQEDAVLRLLEQVGHDQVGQVLAPGVDFGGVAGRHAKIVGDLPRVVGSLQRKHGGFDVRGSVLCKHAQLRVVRRGVGLNAGLVHAGSRVLLVEGPDHSAVVLRLAFVVKEEAAVWHAAHLGVAVGSRRNLLCPVVAVQVRGQPASRAAADDYVGGVGGAAGGQH
eukprot:m.187069 g.187069  ORF g.187069 m.187069 type:complete len:323 (+) comp21615_c0_seq2:1227-2195(+)